MLKSTFNVQAYILKKLNGNIDELTKAMKMQSKWISTNKTSAANKTILEVISLWLEETLLHSTARRRNNDNVQLKLNITSPIRPLILQKNSQKQNEKRTGM